MHHHSDNQYFKSGIEFSLFNSDILLVKKYFFYISNIFGFFEAYDALIKELKEGLEKERNKVTDTEKELQMTKSQLLDAQEQLSKSNQQETGTRINDFYIVSFSKTL